MSLWFLGELGHQMAVGIVIDVVQETPHWLSGNTEKGLLDLSIFYNTLSSYE